MIECRLYDEQNRETWNKFVTNAVNSHFFFYRTFLDYHEDRFFDFSLIFLDTLSGKIIAVFPANKVENTIYSHQGLTFGGMIYERDMTSFKMIQIFDVMQKFLLKNGICKVIYKKIPSIYYQQINSADDYALFRCGSRLVARHLSSFIHLNQKASYRKNRRWGIKNAIKNGIEVSESTDFNSFWPILESTLFSQHGVKPVHSLDEISRLKGSFPDNIKLRVAKRSDDILVGAVCFINSNVVHTQYLASSNEGKKINALDLLIDRTIDEYKLDKRYLNFGISTEDDGHFLSEGLVSYKESFRSVSLCQDIYEWPLNE